MSTLPPPVITLNAAEAVLDALGSHPPVRVAPGLAWADTLVHCAQSIEFSLHGFPRPKPWWFRHTVGPLAFAVFSRRGAMRHDLGAPIPGAPPTSMPGDPDEAAQRLRAAMAAFRAWQGPLRPHFAYGAMDKAAYERAHAMHLAEHLAAFAAA
jgi:hypothetical protein